MTEEPTMRVSMIRGRKLTAAVRGAMLLAGLVMIAPACGSDGVHSDEASLGVARIELTQAERMARYAQIRDAAAGRGIDHTAYLLAGIAYAETNLAHCWSEATWACQGPDSPDCGGGPVIAGAGDGPCSLQQGGLGMFQFDAGTFTDTLNAYGNDVLTVAGNVSHAIDYVVHMVKVSDYTTNAGTDADALQWIANFDVNNGTLRDQWIKTVTRYYNGCQPGWSCWDQRYQHYNDSLQTVLDETGMAFRAVVTDKLPIGYLDAADCDQIKGWAQDPDAADSAVDVHLYFGGPAGSGSPAAALHANVHRDDLCAAIGSCEHGFSTLSPLSLFDGAPHPIHAYGIGLNGGGNAELGDSPKVLTCPAALPAGVRRHVVNPDSLTAWKLDGFWDMIPAGDGEITKLATGEDLPAIPKVVQADDGTPEVWVVDGKHRRHVSSPPVMDAWRFPWAAIEKMPASQVYALTQGPAWRARPVMLRETSGAVWVVDDPAEAEPVDAGIEAGAHDANAPDKQDSGGDAASAKDSGGSGWSHAAGSATGEDGGCSTSGARSRSTAGGWMLTALLAGLVRRRSVKAR